MSAVVLRGDAAHLPLADGSVHAIVCDPPYGLEFMGREWDTFRDSDGFRRSRNEADAGRDSVFGRTSRTSPEYKTGKPSGARIRQRSERDEQPGNAHNLSTSLVSRNAPEAYVAGSPFQRWCETWAREAYRVLKPGGYLLAFGGTRTWHRLVCGIEDAGFEIRDAAADLTGYDAPGLMWVHGQGFPKSRDVAKDIDKRRFGSDDAAAFKAALAEAVAVSGKTRQQINADCGFTMRFDIAYEKDPVGWGCSLPTVEQYDIICRVLDINGDAQGLAALREWPRTRLERLYQVVGYEDRLNSPSGIVSADGKSSHIRREITAPGTEEAARWEGWGTALKPGWEPICVARKPLAGTVAQNVLTYGTGALNVAGCQVESDARPRRVSLSEDTPGKSTYGSNGPGGGSYAAGTTDDGRWPPNVVLGEAAAAEIDRQSGALAGQEDCVPRRGVDSGGASRFFPVFRYQAKAGTAERTRLPDGSAWPTVKPVPLMQWLVRLVTPPGGKVLDLFAGTGPTGEACAIEGFDCILLDRDPKAVEHSRIRLAKMIQPGLFRLEDSAPAAPVRRVAASKPKPAPEVHASLFDLEAS